MRFLIVSSNSSLIQFSAFQYLIHSLTSVQILTQRKVKKRKGLRGKKTPGELVIYKA